MDSQAMELASEPMINLWTQGFVIILMLIGALAHWVNKRVRKEVSGSLVDYIFLKNPANTIYTFVSIVVSAGIASGTGTADIIDPRLLRAMIEQTGHIPERSYIAIAITLKSGWFYDSWLNKGGK